LLRAGTGVIKCILIPPSTPNKTKDRKDPKYYRPTQLGDKKWANKKPNGCTNGGSSLADTCGTSSILLGNGSEQLANRWPAQSFTKAYNAPADAENR